MEKCETWSVFHNERYSQKKNATVHRFFPIYDIRNVTAPARKVRKRPAQY